MITLFTTPKPFRGHIGMIQRNALQSWKRLHPEMEVIVFGDDEGAAQACRDLGLIHHPEVRRMENGLKYLDFIFARAQQIARHATVCYSNCDIVLTTRWIECVRGAQQIRRPFLLVGRRWDLNVTTPIAFENARWEQDLLRRVSSEGKQRGPEWIDYFAFARGLYNEIPPMVIGRVGWDNWLLWKARAGGACVIDSSRLVTAIHQNHDYAYHAQGATGVWTDEFAKRNLDLAGGARCLFTMDDATHALGAQGLRPRCMHHFAPARRKLNVMRSRVWFALLSATRPVRHALGLRARPKPVTTEPALHPASE